MYILKTSAYFDSGLIVESAPSHYTSRLSWFVIYWWPSAGCHQGTTWTIETYLKKILFKFQISPFKNMQLEESPTKFTPFAVIILCMCPANERQCYIVTSSPIGWVHTQNDPWLCLGTNELPCSLLEMYVTDNNHVIVTMVTCWHDKGADLCPMYVCHGVIQAKPGSGFFRLFHSLLAQH